MATVGLRKPAWFCFYLQLVCLVALHYARTSSAIHCTMVAEAVLELGSPGREASRNGNAVLRVVKVACYHSCYGPTTCSKMHRPAHSAIK